MGTMLHTRGVNFDKCFDELNLTKPAADGSNFGWPYIRVALVQGLETTEIALTRMSQVLAGLPKGRA